MGKVIVQLAGVWTFIIIIILIMLAVSPAVDEIATTTADEIASQNNTGIIGIEDAVRSYQIWKWGLPVLLGLAVSGWILYKNREELRRR